MSSYANGRYREPASVPPVFNLPSTWTWASIGQLFDVMVGATPSRTKPEYWGGDIPWVSSGEVAFCTIRATREQITKAGFSASSTKLHPPGTVLLAMIGEGRTRGQAAILRVAACNNQNSAAIRVSETVIPPRFVYWWLSLVYEQTRRASAGGNQPALNKERVREIAIPLPPLPELIAITDLLERFEAEDHLGNLPIDAVHGATLRQSILHAAFTGRLVPQDPEDEPASVLLARLRTAPASPRRGRRPASAAQPLPSGHAA